MHNREDKKVKFGVVGVGNIGKKHAKIIQDKGELVWTCDINQKANYSNIDRALENDVDIVSICTPNHLHYPHALKAIIAGYDVIIEKPITLKAEHAEMLVKTAERMGTNIYLVLQNRYSPTIEWLKSIVPSLGNVYQVHINCFWNRSENYYIESDWRAKKETSGGAVFTQFSHFVDILQYLFKGVRMFDVAYRNQNHPYTDFPDNGSASFLVGEGFGTFNYSTSAKNQNLESSITILAENASIKIGGQYMNEIIECNGIDAPNIECNKNNEYKGYQGSASNHAEMYEAIIDSKLNGTPYIAEPKEGVELVRLCELFS